MQLIQSVVAVAAFVAAVSGHARVTQPKARAGGTTSAANCGAAVYKVLTSDQTGPIESARNKTDSAWNPTTCNFYQCRGYAFADNTANVQNYTLGQSIAFKVDLVAHHTGYANLSVIDLKANKELKRLYTWPVYADSTIPPSAWPANETAFTAVLPALSGACKTAGACALQWYWRATENSQTYVNCVDFVSTA